MDTKALVISLESIGAIIRDSHLIYTSGRHGKAYVNKDALYPRTALTSDVCYSMAKAYATENIEVVLAPALGGIVLSQWVAHHLSDMTDTEVLAVYAEKAPSGEGFVLKRGYDQLIAGKRTLILEDVLTTGGSVKKVVELAQTLGAHVRGVAAFCNRGGLTAEALGAPKLFSLLELTLDSWEAKDCPLCKQGIPINTNVGKGKGSNPF